MVTCKNCGSQYQDGTKFCSKCGAKIEAAAAAPQQQQQPRPQQTTQAQQGQYQQRPQQTNTQQQYQQRPQQNTYQQPQQNPYQQRSQQQPPQYQQRPQQQYQGQGGQQGGDASFDPNEVAANKIYAILAYFGVLFFVPLVACPESKYGRFHANQGLVLLIASFALSVVNTIIQAILSALFTLSYSLGAFGSVISGILYTVVSLAIFVLFIIGVINANKGVVKELPIIGKIRIIK